MNQSTVQARPNLEKVARVAEQVADIKARELSEVARQAERRAEALRRKEEQERLLAEREHLEAKAEEARLLKNRKRRARKGLRSLLELCADKNIQRIVKVYDGSLPFFYLRYYDLEDGGIDIERTVHILFQEDGLCISTSSICDLDEFDTVSIPIDGVGINWEICRPFIGPFDRLEEGRSSHNKSYDLSITQFFSMIAINESLDLENAGFSVQHSKKDRYKVPEDSTVFYNRGVDWIHHVIFEIFISFSQKKVLNKTLIELMENVSKHSAQE